LRTFAEKLHEKATDAGFAQTPPLSQNEDDEDQNEVDAGANDNKIDSPGDAKMTEFGTKRISRG